MFAISDPNAALQRRAAFWNMRDCINATMMKINEDYVKPQDTARPSSCHCYPFVPEFI